MTIFDVPEKKTFQKHCGKSRKILVTFTQNVFFPMTNISNVLTFLSIVLINSKFAICNAFNFDKAKILLFSYG